MLKKSVSSVLGSSKSSTGTRPPHHSAARTDVVLLIRRTLRPRGYASGVDAPAASSDGLFEQPSLSQAVSTYLLGKCRCIRRNESPCSVRLRRTVTSTCNDPASPFHSSSGFFGGAPLATIQDSPGIGLAIDRVALILTFLLADRLLDPADQAPVLRLQRMHCHIFSSKRTR